MLVTPTLSLMSRYMASVCVAALFASVATFAVLVVRMDEFETDSLNAVARVSPLVAASEVLCSTPFRFSEIVEVAVAAVVAAVLILSKPVFIRSVDSAALAALSEIPVV